MRRILVITASALLFLAACTAPVKGWPEPLNTLTVSLLYPDGAGNGAGGEIGIENVSSKDSYRVSVLGGKAVATLPNGIYRISFHERSGGDIFNGSADNIVLAGSDKFVEISLVHSRAGGLVIKELYVGGCSKEPEEGTYQSDQYVLLHNNDEETVWLDSLCFGTLSPYNSTSQNNWIARDPGTGGILYPDFAPVVTVVWKFPGNGRSYPLAPGEDAVICLRGAIDHAARYPNSVNLNRPDCFVCYNPTYFPNTTYHPAPGDRIRQDHILEVAVKTGQTNANTVSISSPTFVIFKARGVTVEEHIAVPDNILVTPGNAADVVVRVPYGWILDGVEVFDGRSGNNNKRLSPTIDAGFVTQSEPFKGHSLRRHTDENASREKGYEVLMDTNNSSQDFYESERQSLHS